MIANILYAIAFLLACLTFLEIYLDDKQKERLSLRTHALWYRLDEMKKLSFVGWLKEPRRRWLYTAIASVCVSIFAVSTVLQNPSVGGYYILNTLVIPATVATVC